MHVVAIHDWQTDNPAVVQAVAEALGALVFEVRQRMAGNGPVVMARFADPQQAETLRGRLEQAGVPAVQIDTDRLRSEFKPLLARQFTMNDAAIQVASPTGQNEAVAYADISLILTATAMVGQSVSTTTETTRKFSLGKTVLAGGIPMTKKVKHQVKQHTSERDEVLCLYSADRPAVLFRREATDYAGLGSAMQLSRELNFNYLKTELRRRASQAVFDDRLRNPASQVRLLGAALNPETHLDLAFEILARTLR